MGADDLSDEALVASLDGDFANGYAEVNGTRLHYVVGGAGEPVVLMGGWPHTWWEYHKVMPELSRRYRVIAVDIRGQGGSAKPESGYDKKNMALDVLELVRGLGYESVHVVGHDIGSMVGYSLAANHPASVRKLVLLDVAHPSEDLLTLPLLPGREQVVDPGPSMGSRPYLWWFGFNQVRGLPERLLVGRMRELIDWLLNYLAVDPAAVDERDRAVYARAYDSAEGIRAGNAWYQAFLQDVADEREYRKLTVPVLGLGGQRNFRNLRDVLARKAENARVVEVPGSGHYIPEERPDVTLRWVQEFLG